MNSPDPGFPGWIEGLQPEPGGRAFLPPLRRLPPARRPLSAALGPGRPTAAQVRGLLRKKTPEQRWTSLANT